ncbi:restriction endonuclease subunit S [Streptomyces hygroscopicus]|uniref:restriction endonuclease subunit S n=1 Tax=Streptomyces hygroscopicus TaxID=1912 RepID=UPI0037BCB23A
MGAWSEYMLGELLAVEHGYAFRSADMCDSLTGKPIVVSIGNFSYSGGFRFSETRVREFRGDYPRSFELAAGDLLVVMTCQTPGGEILGLPGFVPGDGRTYLHNQRIGKVSCDPDRLDKRFAYYLFLSSTVNRQLVGSASGTKILHTSPDRIHAVRCVVPPLVEQLAIAEVLGALDEKVAVNERIQEASRSLVRISFEKHVESSVCRRVSLRDIANLNARKVSPEPYGFLRYIDISSVSPGKYTWPDPIPWRIAPGRARRSVAKGDVIWSTVRPNRASHALVLDEDPRLVASTGFVVLTPRRVGPAYLFAVTSQRFFVDYLVGVAEGSAYPAVHADQFAEAPVILTDETSAQAFEAWAWPVLSRAHEAAVENRTLTELRDTLLPKLVSGQIRIKDAERAIEEVV